MNRLIVALAGCLAFAALLVQSQQTGDAAVPWADPKVVTSVVGWMARETIIYSTPFCYKYVYDRGVGILPTCPSGTFNRAGLCYEYCKPGMQDNGTPTCTMTCPSGYTDTGLLCHWNGQVSYAANVWDGCAWTLFGGCMGGLVYKGCSGNYKDVAGVCWIQPPSGWSGTGLDPIKPGTYSRSGSMPQCQNGLVNVAGLCYQAPQSGYTCQLTACQSNCPQGLSDCGIAGCADTSADCGSSIFSMVIAPAVVLANIFTGGAANVATTAVQVSTWTAWVNKVKAQIMALIQPIVDAAKAVQGVVLDSANAVAVMEWFSKNSDALKGTVAVAKGLWMLAQLVESSMQAAEMNLASVVNSAIASQVVAKYPPGTPNYRMIVRLWTVTYLAMSIASFALAYVSLAVSIFDPTGLFNLIMAFAKPMCGAHTAIP